LAQFNRLAIPKDRFSATGSPRLTQRAEDIDNAEVAAKAFELDHGAKYPKAVAKITDDLDTPPEFYKYPAEYWIHPRTTTLSSPYLPPCDCVSASPRAQDHVPPESPWPTSSSKQ
jgi:hypothetical protein